MLHIDGKKWNAKSDLRVRVRVILRLAVYRKSVRLGDKPHETHDQHFFFQLNTCFPSPYVTSSLTRGWVCRLQLLLALTNKVILRSDSRGDHDHMLHSQIRSSSNLEGQVPYLHPPGTGWPSYTPRHWVLFRRLLRLAGLWWRYSTPPPHGKKSDLLRLNHYRIK
jgi:hypothetical protein